jgi:hypothetical protein
MPLDYTYLFLFRGDHNNWSYTNQPNVEQLKVGSSQHGHSCSAVSSCAFSIVSDTVWGSALAPGEYDARKVVGVPVWGQRHVEDTISVGQEDDKSHDMSAPLDALSMQRGINIGKCSIQDPIALQRHLGMCRVFESATCSAQVGFSP